MSCTALREHLRLLADLSKIVSAMRNLAYAELQRLNRMVAVQAHTEQVVLQALADSRAGQLAGSGQAYWLVIGAERGFCGGFNENLLNALPVLNMNHPNTVWFASGERLCQRLSPLLPPFEALSGCNSAEEASESVDVWLDTLWPRWITTGGGAELFVLHHAEHGLCERRLLPLPVLPAPSPGAEPLRTLPNAVLLPKLQAEWLRVGLLGALYQSLLHENRWRLAQMQRAQDHLDEANSRLMRAYFRQRQADITGELETLMSSLDVTATDRSGLRGEE
ncbi:F0F1 ATP synthase subunit gamma [Crenobacter sp. SG2303]|uniref:F0F1 ATP synthase subunit gamma n=1 Tax=Crenobacter oryzisoli TaxID=3056844 RepID=A0ABT7XSC7_9NEIS|nr:F0F1 ATP synthase subunit gamma [Crenobacter sp. SG2303]MDN0076687.1 F0F1 ATP synthase subunit gamma [Crenobacter sp. SG2303]